MIMLLLVLLVVVEIFVNVWLYNFYKCDFEDSALYANMAPETLRKMCVESLNHPVVTEAPTWVYGTRIDWRAGGLDFDIVTLNSLGMRSPEFSIDKPENTYRIFVMGGSTTFGNGVFDNQTYPFYLQERYDQTNLGFDVEVINAGWPGWNSINEINKIKKELLGYEPDLFIVYDGWNDANWLVRGHDEGSSIKWKERWIEICKLGKQYQFDTLITVHPVLGTGKRAAFVQEHDDVWMVGGSIKILPIYYKYAEQLSELEKYCSVTADLREIFDNVQEPLYFDTTHVVPKGNQIVAEKLYQLSLPLVIEGVKRNFSLNETDVHSFEEINSQLTSKNFDFSSEQFFNFISYIISPYNTPKVFSLIPSDFAFERAYTLDESALDANTLNSEARKLIESRNLQAAIDLLDKALEVNPNHVDALYNKGWALIGLGKQEEAIVWLDRALVLDPNYVPALNMKGNAFLAIYNPEEAIVWFDKALEVNPKYAFALNNKGFALSNLGRYEEAISSYDKALELNPNYKSAQQNKILAQQNLELIKIHPTDANASSSLLKSSRILKEF